ncbi:hypothetical protein AJ79_01347 [Helicocarpus griseus UAMH5409]|uniref:Aminoglycoside phosphotransferase domain-containing protein n=1 Tax=Helicocarpus griseus UAMH5409 TaxID=1447875 RepID=A0A2B7Y7E0_9EURO|nr:hypothetical protein AJ79_01347 [Helicocarpus griseus UAMH5409]
MAAVHVPYEFESCRRSVVSSARRSLNSQVKSKEENVLHKLTYWDKQCDFFTHIHHRRGLVEKAVAHHLGLSSHSSCQAADVKDWMRGSFNLCVPVTVTCGNGSTGNGTQQRRVLMRFPLPHRVGEEFRPGNADEKVRCEAATYAWLGQECPSIPIPHLYGFALSGGQRIMITLSRKPLPKLGSFIIDDNGFLRLENRPLTVELEVLENEHIPLDNVIPRHQSFHSVDSYINRLLSMHDARLRHQPNAVNNIGDCAGQMSALAMMRTVSHEFFDYDLNHGPFVFTLTDLDASNIFVDKDWNIKCLVDLEWGASLPLEFMQPPTWLTNQQCDVIDADKYNELREEFMETLEDEEGKIYEKEKKEQDMHGQPIGRVELSTVMKKTWEIGAFWYILALRSPTGLHALFYKRIQPLYALGHADEGQFYLITHRYWTRGADAVVRQKVADKEVYDRKLREEFPEEAV